MVHNMEYAESKDSLIKRLLFNYNMLCDLIKIYEFLLNAYPNEFLDVNSLNYSRFCNFLKNLSSRILDKMYMDQFIEILKISNIGNFHLKTLILFFFLKLKEQITF